MLSFEESSSSSDESNDGSRGEHFSVAPQTGDRDHAVSIMDETGSHKIRGYRMESSAIQTLRAELLRQENTISLLRDKINLLENERILASSAQYEKRSLEDRNKQLERSLQRAHDERKELNNRLLRETQMMTAVQSELDAAKRETESAREEARVLKQQASNQQMILMEVQNELRVLKDENNKLQDRSRQIELSHRDERNDSIRNQQTLEAKVLELEGHLAEFDRKKLELQLEVQTQQSLVSQWRESHDKLHDALLQKEIEHEHLKRQLMRREADMDLLKREYDELRMDRQLIEKAVLAAGDDTQTHTKSSHKSKSSVISHYRPLSMTQRELEDKNDKLQALQGEYVRIAAAIEYVMTATRELQTSLIELDKEPYSNLREKRTKFDDLISVIREFQVKFHTDFLSNSSMNSSLSHMRSVSTTHTSQYEHPLLKTFSELVTSLRRMLEELAACHLQRSELTTELDKTSTAVESAAASLQEIEGKYKKAKMKLKEQEQVINDLQLALQYERDEKVTALTAAREAEAMVVKLTPPPAVSVGVQAAIDSEFEKLALERLEDALTCLTALSKHCIALKTKHREVVRQKEITLMLYKGFEGLRDEVSLIASGCVAVPLEASHSPSHHSSGSGSGFYTNTARKAHGNRNGNGYQEEELDVVECLWEFDETMVNTRREASHQHPRGHGHSNNHTRKMPLYNNGAYNTTSPGSYRNGDTATARLSPGTAFTSMSPGPRNARGRTYVRIPLRSVAICILAGMRLARVLRELRHGKRRQKASFEGLADWNGFSSDVSSGIGIGAGTSNSNGSDSDIGVIGAGDGSPGVDNEQYKVYCRKLLSHYIIPPKYQLQRCPTESSLAQLVIDRAEEHDGMLSGIVFDSDYNGEYRPSLLELLTGAKGKTHPGLEMARGMYNYDMFGLGVLARVEETMVSMSRSLVDLRAKEALFQFTQAKYGEQQQDLIVALKEAEAVLQERRARLSVGASPDSRSPSPNKIRLGGGSWSAGQVQVDLSSPHVVNYTSASMSMQEPADNNNNNIRNVSLSTPSIVGMDSVQRLSVYTPMMGTPTASTSSTPQVHSALTTAATTPILPDISAVKVTGLAMNPSDFATMDDFYLYSTAAAIVTDALSAKKSTQSSEEPVYYHHQETPVSKNSGPVTAVAAVAPSGHEYYTSTTHTIHPSGPNARTDEEGYVANSLGISSEMKTAGISPQYSTSPDPRIANKLHDHSDTSGADASAFDYHYHRSQNDNANRAEVKRGSGISGLETVDKVSDLVLDDIDRFLSPAPKPVSASTARSTLTVVQTSDSSIGNGSGSSTGNVTGNSSGAVSGTFSGSSSAVKSASTLSSPSKSRSVSVSFRSPVEDRHIIDALSPDQSNASTVDSHTAGLTSGNSTANDRSTNVSQSSTANMGTSHSYSSQINSDSNNSSFSSYTKEFEGRETERDRDWKRSSSSNSSYTHEVNTDVFSAYNSSSSGVHRSGAEPHSQYRAETEYRDGRSDYDSLVGDLRSSLQRENAYWLNMPLPGGVAGSFDSFSTMNMPDPPPYDYKTAESKYAALSSGTFSGGAALSALSEDAGNSSYTYNKSSGGSRYGSVDTSFNESVESVKYSGAMQERDLERGPSTPPTKAFLRGNTTTDTTQNSPARSSPLITESTTNPSALSDSRGYEHRNSNNIDSRSGDSSSGSRARKLPLSFTDFDDSDVDSPITSAPSSAR